MDSLTKTKEWINQNVPTLAKLYENKYVGMLYDRFASLSPNRQKQVILGTLGGVSAIAVIFIFSLYISFWSEVRKADQYQSMIDMLLQFQKIKRSQEGDLAQLDRNRALGTPDALKQYLIEQGKMANISPRMMKAEEKGDSGSSTGGSDMRLKSASVRLEKVNLSQFRDFMKNVETGPYSLIVSSVSITNDDKLRGYMNAELTVAAYLFKGEDELGL